MRRILSIFNSKKYPVALLLAVLVILALEFKNERKFPGKYFAHEVDHILRVVDTRKFDASIVYLGDSVGRQILQSDPELVFGKPYANLPTNASIETTGQLFFLKRYLARNKKPRVIIYASRPFQGGTLSSLTAENFIQRTFGNFSEVLEVASLKRELTFPVKTLAYKFFPSLRFRLLLQKKYTGFTNAEIYTGTAGNITDKPEKLDYSILSVFQNQLAKEDISVYHFEELVKLADSLDIDFYFLPVIYNVNQPAVSHSYAQLFKDVFPGLKKKYKHFHYSTDLQTFPPELFKSDGVHFNKKGLAEMKKDLMPFVYELNSRYLD